MLGKKFEDLSLSDFDNLIANGIAENASLEYKRDLPKWDSSGKHEFLADVSAMANHHGGYILYGMAESDEGTAEEIFPQKANPDSECLRILDVLNGNLEPKLSGCKVKAVSTNSDGYIFVLSVPESWCKPHRVKTNNHFFVREGARKRQLEMPEIKIAFLNSENPKKKITDFRSERLSKVITGDSPIQVAEGIVQLLHVIPLEALQNNFLHDVNSLAESRAPVMSSGYGVSSRINIDGVIFHRAVTDRGTGAYTQLFRNGFVESVRVFQKSNETTRTVLPSVKYESEIMDFLRELKRAYASLEIEGPLVLLYSLLNVKGAQLGVSNSELLDEGNGIFDRNQILLPDVILEESTQDEGEALRPLFNMVWNAAGYRGSLNYDTNTGIWIARQ